MDFIKDMNTDNKRTEKLVSALYLLTSFFDDKEPMKWRLRELGGRLVSSSYGQSVVTDIIGLLKVSRNAGLISDTNFDIIHREFLVLDSQGQSIADVLRGIGDAEPVKSINVPNISREITERASLPAVFHKPQTTFIKDKITREPSESGAVAVKKNGRQGTILSLLKKKQEIMIKDVTPLIEGVSEKTIQRELLSMVSQGILKKEGEKRWSRYTLA